MNNVEASLTTAKSNNDSGRNYDADHLGTCRRPYRMCGVGKLAATAGLSLAVVAAMGLLAAPEARANSAREMQFLPSDGHGRLNQAPSGWQPQNESRCGLFWLGCGDRFYTTSQSGRPASFYLGDMQGVFKFKWKLPTSGVTSGRAKWSIYEKRTGSSHYRLVKTFRPGNQSGRKGWWSYSKPRDYVSLDGRIKVEVTRLEGTIGVSEMKLEHRTGLPEHMAFVELQCIHHHIMWSPQAINGMLIGTLLGTYVSHVFEAGPSTVEDKLMEGGFHAGLVIGLAVASSDENVRKIGEVCAKELERTREHFLYGTLTKHVPSHHYYVIGDLSYYNDCEDLVFLDIEICPRRRN